MKRFVLVLALAGCSGVQQAARTTAEPRYGDDWFAVRAAVLGIELDAARARDAALPEDAPPEGLEDAHVMDEAARLWTALCAKCHGEDGEPPQDLDLVVRPKRWTGMGPAMGFFFGGDDMRAGIYRRIADGGEVKEGQPSPMPAFRETLSREQIWALVRHIEGF